MILQLNHLQGKAAAGTTHDIVAALYGLLEEGHLDQKQFAHIQVQLDWVQYKQNFRQMVSVIRPLCEDRRSNGRPPILDIRVDTRQIVADHLKSEIVHAIAGTHTAEDEGAIILEDFTSFRNSIAWQFNHAYWAHVREWEIATGKGYEQALPGGSSDGNNDAAITDSAVELWTLFHDMETRKQLPAELPIMEIGVGNGSRSGRFATKMRDLDRERGTGFYPKLRPILGDFSDETLEMARPAMKEHEHTAFIPLDALNPIKTLSTLRHKLLYIHSTNMYDNLPDEELVRRDDKLYFVRQRAFVPGRDARKLAEDFGIQHSDVRPMIDKLLEGRLDFLGSEERSMKFWMQLWPVIRFEERLAAPEDLQQDPFPFGLDQAKTEDMLQGTAANLRIHLSSGALESFTNTLPLLHPRGYLQVQDIFVKEFNDYRLGFFGPGKLDGSIVNWVNGALLREVAERSGYNVTFAPYPYRKGSKTSVLYTTPRE